MSMMMCAFCDELIDTDWNVEHFNSEGKCLDVDVGERCFDGKYGVDLLPDPVKVEDDELAPVREFKCGHCDAVIDYEGISLINSDGYVDFFLGSWCSWDCVQETETKNQHRAEAQIKQGKIDRSMCKEDPRWPDRYL